MHHKRSNVSKAKYYGSHDQAEAGRIFYVLTISYWAPPLRKNPQTALAYAAVLSTYLQTYIVHVNGVCLFAREL